MALTDKLLKQLLLSSITNALHLHHEYMCIKVCDADHCGNVNCELLKSLRYEIESTNPDEQKVS